jgi:hypothetical protein
MAHVALQDDRMTGEWFTCSLSRAKRVIQRVADIVADELTK